MNVILYSMKSVFFALIVAYLSFIGTLFGHSISLFLGLGKSQTNFLDSISGVLPYIIVITFLAIVIGELFKMLNQTIIERFITIFAYHYFFFYALPLFDKFARGSEFSYSYELVRGILPAFFFSLLVTLFWKPGIVGASFQKELKNYLKSICIRKWLKRLFVGWSMFVPIVFFTNWLISPFLELYNTTAIQNVPKVIIMSIFVSIFFVLTILPIFIRWRDTKTSLLYWVGFPIFIQTAVFPALVEFWLPIGVRFPYFIQYMVISFMLAIIYVHLLYVPKANEVIDDQFKWMY
ncbi:hypothetical protein H1D32_15425 [Anaerobacillus sp. CMMVII]|uniref:hypothetical protein n=1 Tax=Anaerobacillus sp. CMMVII TaxID=2755588 RepID=UPI0021B7673E|nr:hypothetical protein [Anaerobacillus sp. CMMVII]MCT8138979.1 hypothetical protein [Anaerobacillus sp. CMMVII]